MQKIHPARKFYGIRPIASVCFPDNDTFNHIILSCEEMKMESKSVPASQYINNLWDGWELLGIAIAKDDPNSSRKYRRAEFKRNQKIQKAGN